MSVLRREWDKAQKACIREIERRDNSPPDAVRRVKNFFRKLSQYDLESKLDDFEKTLPGPDDGATKSARKAADSTAGVLSVLITRKCARRILDDGEGFWEAVLDCKKPLEEIQQKMADMQRAAKTRRRR